MRIVNILLLDQFALKHANARKSLATWKKITIDSVWRKGLDILNSFPTAKILQNSRARFEIKHNVYRLVADVDYKERAVDIRFIGTHADYEKIDVLTI